MVLISLLFVLTACNEKLTLTLTGTPSTIEIKQGETAIVDFSLALAGDQKALDDLKPVLINISETNPTGLTVNSNHSGSYTSDAFNVWTFKQSITGDAEGSYNLSINASIDGQKVTATKKTVVNVIKATMPHTLKISSNTQSLLLNEGESATVLYTVDLGMTENKSIKLNLMDSIPDGLSVQSDNPGTIQITQANAYSIRHDVNAIKAGQYKLQLSANIEGENISDQSTVDVTVKPVIQPTINVTSDVQLLQMKTGESEFIKYNIIVDNDAGESLDINIIETVPENGLKIKSDGQGTYSTTTSKTFTLSHEVTAENIGKYEIKLDATIRDKDINASVTLPINVILKDGEGNADPEINHFAIMNGAFEQNKESLARFVVGFTQTLAADSVVTIQRVSNHNGGKVLDEFGALEKRRHSNNYDGQYTVQYNSGPIYYRAMMVEPGKEAVYSNVISVDVVPFPQGFEKPDPTKVIRIMSLDNNNSIIQKASIIAPTSDHAISMPINEFIVEFETGIISEDINAIADQHDGKITGMIKLDKIDIYQLRIENLNDIKIFESTLKALEENSKVKTATMNLIISEKPFPATPITDCHKASTKKTTPNDTCLSLQYYLDKIRAKEAWLISKGNERIAVIDSGLDIDHVEFKNKYKSGYNIYKPNESPNDTLGHGSQVAGILAAETNNGIGISGISWDSEIYPIKRHDNLGTIKNPENLDYLYLDVISGIHEAIKKNIKIVNISAGLYESFDYPSYIDCKTCKVVLQYYLGYMETAIQKAAGKALIVAAAGNEGHNKKKYPAGYAAQYNHVIAVGATKELEDIKTVWSNSGSWVTLAAPGENILSTKIHNSIDPTSGYISDSGTSLSTPQVTGAAAILFSKYPHWSPEQVKKRLIISSKKLLNNDFGYGMLDIFESVFNGSIEHTTLYGWRKVSRDKVLGDQLIDFDNSRNIDGSDYANHHDANISQTFALKLHDEYSTFNGGGCDTCFPYGTDINVDDPHDDSDKFLALTVSESSFEEQVNSSAHDGRTVKYISINQPFVIQEHVKKFKISFDYFLIGEYFAPMPMRNDRTVGASSTYRIYIKFKNKAGEELAYIFFNDTNNILAALTNISPYKDQGYKLLKWNTYNKVIDLEADGFSTPLEMEFVAYFNKDLEDVMSDEYRAAMLLDNIRFTPVDENTSLLPIQNGTKLMPILNPFIHIH